MRRPPEGVAAAPALSTGLLLAVLFAGDSVWVAIVVLIVAGAWAALGLLGRARLPAAGSTLLGALLATAVWSGLSIVWSVAPDRTWAELDRTLVYAALLTLGMLVGAAAGARRSLHVLVAALGAAVLWALAGKAVPALFSDGGRAARLRDPIGYWNALALAADMLLVLALVLALDARSRLARGGVAALGYASVVAILLTASRAGVAAAVLGVVLVLLLRSDRVETALLAVVVALPGSLLAAWAFTRPGLVENGASHGDRVADGAVFGVLLLAGAALVAWVAGRLEPPGPARRVLVGRVLVAAAVLGIAAAALVSAGRIADECDGGEVTNEPGRLWCLSSNNRSAWWGEAWDVFRADPLVGAGANTFEVARKRHRVTASPVTQPHSVPLQLLAGTGLVGLALFAALVAAAAAAAMGALRRLSGGERNAAAALAVVPVLWLAHALVDYPWDFVEVTGPALFAAGVLAAVARPPRGLVSPFAAAGVAAVALAAAAAVATPWLAERSVRQVGVELARGDLEAAESAATRARSLDPLALAPVFAQARVEEARRDEAAALAAYLDATRLQPENPEAWLELGLYEFDLGDRCSAYVHLNEAYTLDPAGKQWEPGGPLVQALAWVNGGNC